MQIYSLRVLKIYGQSCEGLKTFVNGRYSHALARCVHDPHTLSLSSYQCCHALSCFYTVLCWLVYILHHHNIFAAVIIILLPLSWPFVSLWSLSCCSYSPFDKTQSHTCLLLWQILAIIIKLYHTFSFGTHLSNLLVIKTVIVFMPLKQSHPHYDFVLLWYLGTCVTFIGFWKYIKILPSLHLY